MNGISNGRDAPEMTLARRENRDHCEIDNAPVSDDDCNVTGFAASTGNAPETSRENWFAEPTAVRNIRMMRVLDRIAARFNAANIPLMALKGAALNLTLYDRPTVRPMQDLDLIIRTQDVRGAFGVLEELGALRGASLVREDFFPRFHYEMDYTIGAVYPVRLDLHVRPFRPLRYGRVVPPEALWESAECVQLDKGSILIPCVEDMLIHLAAHAAIHGCDRRMWLTDIERWTTKYADQIDWERFFVNVEEWRLALPVQQTFVHAERELGRFLPSRVLTRLERMSVNWRDRLALHQAPRDADHPKCHVAVNVLTTPGWRFTVGYLRAVLFPCEAHMADWYCGRHRGWLACAHALRWLAPLVARIPTKWRWFTKIETRESGIHGVGVFATCSLKSGEVVARYHGHAVEKPGTYVSQQKEEAGETRYVELTGKLKYLNHSCRANSKLDGFRLISVRPIMVGQEITIDYGHGTCHCKKGEALPEEKPRVQSQHFAVA